MITKHPPPGHGWLQAPALAFAAVATLGACGSPRVTHPLAADGLPLWDGEARALFDDGIDAVAVGLALDGRSPAEDPYLLRRTESGDFVGRVTVRGLDIGRAGAKTLYTLNVRAVPPPMSPPHTEQRDFDLEIGPAAPAFGVVRTVEHDLRDHLFIAFLKRFHGPDGPEVHFHLTADTPEVVAAVREAAALDEVRGRDGS